MFASHQRRNHRKVSHLYILVSHLYILEFRTLTCTFPYTSNPEEPPKGADYHDHLGNVRVMDNASGLWLLLLLLGNTTHTITHSALGMPHLDYDVFPKISNEVSGVLGRLICRLFLTIR